MVRGSKVGSSPGGGGDYLALKSQALDPSLYLTIPNKSLLCKNCDEVPPVPYKCKGCVAFTLCYECAAEHYGDSGSRTKTKCFSKCGSTTTKGVGGLNVGWVDSEWEHLKSFKLKCPHTDMGCGVSGLFSDVLAHLDKTCPHHPVDCTECGDEFPRQESGYHEARCPERVMGCHFSGCKVTMKRRQLAAHTASCGFKPLVCPDCASGFQLRGKELHERYCPKRLVDCEVCEEKVPADEREEHLGSGHMEMIADKLSELQESIESLQEAKGDLEERLENSETEAAEFKVEMRRRMKKSEAEALELRKRVDKAEERARDLQFQLSGFEVDVDKQPDGEGPLKELGDGRKYRLNFYNNCQGLRCMNTRLYEPDGRSQYLEHTVRALHPTDPKSDVTVQSKNTFYRALDGCQLSALRRLPGVGQ